MSKIENKNLYPYEETPVLKHYSEFDSVYVGLLPFFKLDKEHCDTNSSKKVISIEEAREKDEIIEKIGNHLNVTIYSSNECYPTDEEISQNGKKVTWKEIIQNTKLNDNKDMNKALMTSIGAFKKKLQREDLLDILNQYSDKNNIWHPSEGAFDFFTKSSIFEILKSNGISKVDVEDEFYENKKTINLNELTQNDFCEKIDFKDYYIYDNNQSILFAISWDYFFFFIAINERVFSKESIETKFEGFWADEKSSHLWTWEEGEIDRLLNDKTEIKKKKTSGNTGYNPGLTKSQTKNNRKFNP
ncbi:DUF2711 domain-containing protein [Aureisphaera sp. CAU 1614]|uniref:DUF2711 domain-containing protein n=1 Tax=Halomarinibacterium sedimenti TaxID=2857106 RepID=A0A9X1FPU0_9FLAO|nr:DUF2711 family protein [Halomarinibacterium sedimenti]MBW2938198.1 DUF2711 domain-containing protein [Halomarinibacterium sedimenti]